MAQVTLDYKKGDKIIVLIDGKFLSQTFTGNASLVLSDGGEKMSVSYEVDIKDSIYSSQCKRVDSEHCYHSIEEAMEKTGLAALQDAEKTQS